MLWIANSRNSLLRAETVRELVGNGGFGRKTMYSVDPHPTCPSCRKSTYAVFPFSRHGVMRATRVSPFMKRMPEPNGAIDHSIRCVTTRRHVGHVEVRRNVAFLQLAELG